MSKTVLMTLGACLAVALAVAAPVEATAPSTAAERIVNARIHRKPPVPRLVHQKAGRPAKKKYHAR